MPLDIISGEAAAAAIAAEPWNGMLYGGPGVGKTTQAVEAFTRDGRCTAFFVQCEEGALKPILARGSVIPDHPKGGIVVGWDAMYACFEHVHNNRGRYTALIVDNLTAWTANTEVALKAQGYGKRNGWEIPIMIRDYLITMRRFGRQLGVHIVYLAHAREAYTEDGFAYLGGPALYPKKAASLFYGAVDTMLRAGYLQAGNKINRVFYTGGLEWPVEYGMMPPADLLHWFQKNREGVQPAVVPADLGAYLRARRPPYAGL